MPDQRAVVKMEKVGDTLVYLAADGSLWVGTFSTSYECDSCGAGRRESFPIRWARLGLPADTEAKP